MSSMRREMPLIKDAGPLSSLLAIRVLDKCGRLGHLKGCAMGQQKRVPILACRHLES